MTTIKLPRLPTEEQISVRFKMPAGKHAELLDYLVFFNEVHGSDADLHALLPHLVAAFLTEDRAFARWRAAHQTKAQPNLQASPPKRIGTPRTEEP